MTGWIIQGVRGEGKSLAAVGKIKEYMLRGCPVATNLDLYLDKFLPADNKTIAYRLPDHPRLVDFQLLPPAYDVKYKKDDHNGLLVLDELGTWLNARNWNDKSRLEMLNWLFLSRKDHWDVILLAQDFEMIDSQVRTTLCDYLVQASRLDRQKIPYLSGLLKQIGFSGKFARVHRYAVYYGMSTATPPQDKWSFTGREFYDGYNTNQKFQSGMEPLGGTLVDMRATYSYLPACYLTKQIFIERLEKQIVDLKKSVKKSDEVGKDVAKKNVSTETQYFKIGLLCLALVCFIGWRIFHGIGIPSVNPIPAVAAAVAPVVPVAASTASFLSTDNKVDKIADKKVLAIETENFVDYLIARFRPRLSSNVYSEETGFQGFVDFYDSGVLVESYSMAVLHSLGVTLVHREYGADLIYKGKSYILTRWVLPVSKSVQAAADKVDKTKDELIKVSVNEN